jgi:hypothetical protein
VGANSDEGSMIVGFFKPSIRLLDWHSHLKNHATSDRNIHGEITKPFLRIYGVIRSPQYFCVRLTYLDYCMYEPALIKPLC